MLEQLRFGRIGRMPIWAIGAVIAVLILVFIWWRKRGEGGTAPSQDTLAVNDQAMYYDGYSEDVYGLPPGAIGNFLDNNPLDPAYPVGLTANGVPGPITNVQWSRLAFDYLIGKGNDPSLVERALSKYIAGLALSVEERSIVNLAQQAFGAPPEGLINSPTPTNDSHNGGGSGGGGGGSSGPVPTSPGKRRYAIVAKYVKSNPPWNSTLGGIAAKYGRTVTQLIDWNNLSKRPKVGGAPVIFTGEKIWVDPA